MILIFPESVKVYFQFEGKIKVDVSPEGISCFWPVINVSFPLHLESIGQC